MSTVAVTRPYRGRRIAPALSAPFSRRRARARSRQGGSRCRRREPDRGARPLHRHGLRHGAVGDGAGPCLLTAHRRAGTASTSPTTAPTSTAGRSSPDCARCRASSRRRSRRLPRTARRRRSPSPAGPMPGCTRPARSRTSTSRAEQLASARASRTARGAPLERRRARSRRLNGIAGLVSDVVVHGASHRARGVRRALLADLPPLRVPGRGRVAPRDPLLRRHTVWYPATLDVEAMNVAAHEPARAARLRRVLQAARGRDDHPHAAGVRVDARRRRRARRRPSRPTRSATAWCGRWSAPASRWARASSRASVWSGSGTRGAAHQRVQGDAGATDSRSSRSATRQDAELAARAEQTARSAERELASPV